MSDAIAISSPAPAPRGRAWRREARATIALAAPIIVAQLGWVAMHTTDAVMIGRLGPGELAAASLVLPLYFTVWVASVGVIMATAPLAAQAFGARRPRLLRRVVRQGLWIAIALTLPGCAVLAFAEDILVALGQPRDAARLAGLYMSTLLWSLPFSVVFQVLRNFVAALSRPGVATVTMLAGALLNVLLDYALIFGHFGMPRLELVGAGITTTTVNIAMVVLLGGIAAYRRPFRRYAIFGRLWRPDWEQFRRIFRIGLPIAGIYLLESGMFIGSFLAIGAFGPVALAAHMIAIQAPHVTFMVPMGLAQAATVRVGQAVGRGDAMGAYRAGWTAVMIALLFSFAASLFLLTTPDTLVALFLGGVDAETAAVAALAAHLLFFAAALQLGDGLQAVAAGALRGLNQTAMPMLIAAIGYWAVGASLAVALAFGLGFGAAGIWTGFVAGLSVTAVLLLARFRSLAKRRYIPPVPTEAEGT